MARSSAQTSKHPRARKWLRRGLIVLLVVANVVVFGAIFTARNLSQTFEANLTRDTDVVQALTPTSAQASGGDGDTVHQPPSTFLILGSDSRADLDEDLEGNFGTTAAGARADVIMLMQIFPDEHRAQVLSLPRDLKVDIEGYGTNKINAAYAFGGSELVVRTVKQATGLPIHHYVEVDFSGFAAIVDQLGGITIDFPYPARDTHSGFAVDAGHQTLDGSSALAYARSRHYQERRNGSWVSVDGGDIGRTRRQQQIILAILTELKQPSSIADASGILEAFAGYVTVDATLSQKTLLDLAWAMRSIDASSIEAVTLPTYGKMIDGHSYQLPKEPDASQVIAAFAAGESLQAKTEGPIRVQVLNGNGIAGAAGRAAALLDSPTFEVADIGDADSSDFATTVILARSDRHRLAEAVADALGFGTVSFGTVPNDIDVVVIVGKDAPAA
ncbi:MAG: hypothetical protein GWP04_00935 [Gammaproteobacteria bacterium]|nr:hypothetical protein [Gammaproteobacteria bacterium]